MEKAVGANPSGTIMKNVDNMELQAGELDKWLRFAGCAHLGYIATGMGIDTQGSMDLSLIVYWDKTRAFVVSG